MTLNMKEVFEILEKLILPVAAILIPIVLSKRTPELYKRALERLDRFWAIFPFIGKYIVIHKAGIHTIFLNQKDISKYRKDKDMVRYIINHTIDSFTYVGIWLSDFDSYDKLSESLYNMLCEHSHIVVNLYFRNPEMTKSDEEWLNVYYNCIDSKENVEKCVDYWMRWKSSMKDPHVQDRIKIYIHSCNLTCSFFLFNSKLDAKVNQIGKEIIFFDQKLFGCPKQNSISMEINLKKTERAFSNTIADMYEKVRSNSILCNDKSFNNHYIH